MNVVLFAETIWNNHEPQNGSFYYSSLNYVMDAMEKAGIGVDFHIIPTHQGSLQK
jgi:Beta-galactosidase.